MVFYDAFHSLYHCVAITSTMTIATTTIGTGLLLGNTSAEVLGFSSRRRIVADPAAVFSLVSDGVVQSDSVLQPPPGPLVRHHSL